MVAAAAVAMEADGIFGLVHVAHLGAEGLAAILQLILLCVAFIACNF